MPSKDKTTNGSRNGRVRAPDIGERLAQLETHREYFATKADMQRQDGKLASITENMATKADIAALDAKIDTGLAALNAKIAANETAREKSEATRFRWTIGIHLSSLALLFALLRLF